MEAQATRRLSAVLFDLDGTLVDSAGDLRHALNHVLAREGLRPLTLEEVKGMIGDGAPKLVERGLVATGGPLSRFDELLQAFLETYQQVASRETRPYPGVADTLSRLRAAGLALGVVTNKPAAATAAMLDQLGLAPFFAVVVGGDTLPERKPHPAPLRHALKALGAAPERALMVGDNHHDVSAARAAGLGAIAVTYGYSHKPHAELGADHLVERLSDILPLLGVEVAP